SAFVGSVRGRVPSTPAGSRIQDRLTARRPFPSVPPARRTQDRSAARRPFSSVPAGGRSQDPLAAPGARPISTTSRALIENFFRLFLRAAHQAIRLSGALDTVAREQELRQDPEEVTRMTAQRPGPSQEGDGAAPGSL